MNKVIICLLASVALGASAGCQSQDTATTKKTGSYTAARRNTLGSHIPQPYSADSTGSTYDPDAWSQYASRQGNINIKKNSGGVGGD